MENKPKREPVGLLIGRDAGAIEAHWRTIFRLSNERREAWLTSPQRYTYPPGDIQEAFSRARDARGPEGE